jgi:hypothetical protein
MTALPGRVELLPDDLEAWLNGLAAALLPLHALEPGPFPWQYAPYNDVTQLQLPDWSSCPAAWKHAIEIVHGRGPTSKNVLFTAAITR